MNAVARARPHRRGLLTPSDVSSVRQNLSGLDLEDLCQSDKHFDRRVGRLVAFPPAAFNLLVVRAREASSVGEVFLCDVALEAELLEANSEVASVRLPGRRGGRG